MGIHIVVCIKQTPATSNIQIDPVTGTLKREGHGRGHQSLRRIRD
jgi:electron transfer flavoprotein alpha/beta subunit